ncbi:cobalt-zinc-cadmium efflux system protein [Catalinimonas alkaloidigena]|uniref:cation diffusion facilitator family transporter n=1 Tax=Catalinimonas alkaloidigena TaxID=1075417 RepID=UPI0024057ECD|nr:cation diffusion facilitator family transporter [Catalinimonas alkaloidigena]MDF9797510.1 cobalt-zinc-cadmium efflux system protein [Catalinimonas alkaloidigena]
MGHHHQGDHHDHEEGHHHHAISSNLKVAFFLNLSFTIIEFVGGIFTNSMAILSDAIHDLGDTFAIGSSLFLENYSQKGRSKKYSFGYKRFSPLSALINSVILLAGSVIIIVEAIPRLINPESVNAQGMLYLAIAGIVFNGAAVFRLKKGGKSINQRTVMLHLLEDVLGWAAVLIGSIVMIFADLPVIDPILSLCIAVYILWNAFRNLQQVMNIFLQATPDNIDIEKVKAALSSIEDIQEMHDTHIWTLDGDYNILSIHLVIKKNMRLTELAELRAKVNHVLKNFHIDHITTQFEVPGEVCELEKH